MCPSRSSAITILILPALLLVLACSESVECGPSEAWVSRVIDGDTVQLSGGELVRYLLVDTPEVRGTQSECFAERAFDANRSLVEQRRVELRYDDAACTDRFGRLLAHVSVAGREVNSLLVERGYACVMHVPPGGDARVQEFRALETKARASGLGLWGACAVSPCSN